MVRKVPTKGAGWCAKENSREFLQRLTFQAADVAQVDARHVRDARQVLRQSELAAAVQIDAVLAVLGADVADHADDGAGEDTWNTREGTFRQKVRTGARSGNFIRCVLTLNLLAHIEAHEGQVRAVLEHLDFT